MSKIIISIFAFMSLSYADAITKSMHAMESGLNDIQKGFLYNQRDMILLGAKEIANANKIFNKNHIKKVLPKGKKHLVGVTKNQAVRIEHSTADLVTFVKANDMSSASNSYSNIINACTSCHAIVRGW